MTASQVHDGASYLTSGQFANRLGISPRTYRRWLQKGHIRPAFWTPTGHARWTEAQVSELLNRRDKAA